MHLIYTYSNKINGYIVGTNKTEDFYSNAISDHYYKGIVKIPELHNGLSVKEIGQYAFCRCPGITDVLIYAKITAIHKYAFGDCPSLRTINIPDTVTFLGSFSIYSYNQYNHTNSGPTTLGFIVISFEPGSKLRTICRSVFGRIEHIVLKTYDDLSSVSCEEPIVGLYTSFDVLSPISFELCSSSKYESTVVKNIDYYHDFQTVERILLNIKQVTCKRSFYFNLYTFFFTSIMLF